MEIRRQVRVIRHEEFDGSVIECIDFDAEELAAIHFHRDNPEMYGHEAIAARLTPLKTSSVDHSGA